MIYKVLPRLNKAYKEDEKDANSRSIAIFLGRLSRRLPVIHSANRRSATTQLRFTQANVPKKGWMSVSKLRCFLCWAMIAVIPASLLGQSAQTPSEKTQTDRAETPVAIIHTQGGVSVNGYEATDSSALFAGDLMETKPGFS